jgi:predicted nuclease with RNAse H fold
VRALGIDVGVGKGHDLVLLDDRRAPMRVVGRAGLDEVRAAIVEGKPDVVAIDAPPAWAASGRSRLTENELARLNIHAFRTPAPEHAEGRQFDWMRAGMEVYRVAAELGYPRHRAGSVRCTTIEVFPHATAAVLVGCLPPEGVPKRRWRERILREQRVRLGDLATADLTGLLALDGHLSALGDPREGTIVLPIRVPAPRYRRGTLADDGSDRLFRACACGEPGCAATVRAPREFAPGHDAKRKSRLWREAREGTAALEELRRRGWRLPSEMS